VDSVSVALANLNTHPHSSTVTPQNVVLSGEMLPPKSPCKKMPFSEEMPVADAPEASTPAVNMASLEEGRGRQRSPESSPPPNARSRSSMETYSSYSSSGREVCHTIRKFEKRSSSQRVRLLTSVSGAFSAIHRKASSITASTSSFRRTSSSPGPISPRAARIRSWHSSMCSRYSDVDDDQHKNDKQPKDKSTLQVAIYADTITIEFSNYARVEVKKRGSKVMLRYKFEYWAYAYTWKRVKIGKTCSYHLYRENKGAALAHIVPV
jgi:hypothetical protein